MEPTAWMGNLELSVASEVLEHCVVVHSPKCDPIVFNREAAKHRPILHVWYANKHYECLVGETQGLVLDEIVNAVIAGGRGGGAPKTRGSRLRRKKESEPSYSEVEEDYELIEQVRR